jgi:nicotinate phosphoribosyltransferase
VYKLAAIQSDDGQWQPRIKVSEQMLKTSNPGVQQVRRYFRPDGKAMCDMIFDELQSPPSTVTIVDPLDPTNRQAIAEIMVSENLLQPVFQKGELIRQTPTLVESRTRAITQLQQFPTEILRFDNPQTYRVGLEHAMYDLKMRMVVEAKQAGASLANL